MQKIIHFGFSSISCRSETGALLGRELEKIYGFLKQHGMLIAECFDGCIVVAHPDLFEKAMNVMKGFDFHRVMIAANLHSLLEKTSLSIAEIRVMESFCPGALIVADASDDDQKHMNVAIPDSFDLRDICSLYNGSVNAFFLLGRESITAVAKKLEESQYKKYGFSNIGVLESPNYDGDYPPSKATIVQIDSPDNVKCLLEGDIDLEIIREASKAISIWEIGEWT